MKIPRTPSKLLFNALGIPFVSYNMTATNDWKYIIDNLNTYMNEVLNFNDSEDRCKIASVVLDNKFGLSQKKPESFYALEAGNTGTVLMLIINLKTFITNHKDSNDLVSDLLIELTNLYIAHTEIDLSTFDFNKHLCIIKETHSDYYNTASEYINKFINWTIEEKLIPSYFQIDRSRKKIDYDTKRIENIVFK